jgi:valyl-tRNA synthetase
MVDVSAIDAPRPADKDVLDAVALLKTAVQGVRAIRNAKNIAKKEELSLQVVGENPIEALGGLLAKMAGTTPAERVEKKSDDASAFIVGTTEFAVPLGHLIDVSAEIEKAEADLKHLEGFLAGVLKKLSNERFVANAPEAVVALERKKQSDAEQKIAVLKETLAKLKK